MKPKSFFILALYVFSFQLLAAEEIIKRPTYILNYNEDHEVANWVSYELDHAKLQNCVSRTNSFRSDPQVSTGSATSEDYRGSGYDRGHLLPAGDMKYDAQAMRDTFFFSNMTPQPPKFNQVKWAQLETLVRAWALSYKKIWIVTGPVLEDNLPYIGSSNKVSIPNLYYKMILRQTGRKYESIAFLVSTAVTHQDLKAYVTSVNEIEEITGFDFFQFLTNAEEETVEDMSDASLWDFKAKFEYLPCRTSVSL